MGRKDDAKTPQATKKEKDSMITVSVSSPPDNQILQSFPSLQEMMATRHRKEISLWGGALEGRRKGGRTN